MKAKRRFTEHTPSFTAVKALRAGHDALAHAKTLYGQRVRDPDAGDTLLKSGEHSRKIGGTVVKGAWAGMPIFTLTLEERASCPRECQHWATCVVPETRTLTTDLNWVRLGDIDVGHELLGFDEFPADGERRKTRAATVLALGRAKMPCFRVVTDKAEVVASADHLWLARPAMKKLAIDPAFHFDWRATAGLKVGDSIQWLAAPWQQDFSYEAGRIRGFVEGEGHLGVHDNDGFPKASLTWAQLPGTLMDEINDLVRAKGFQVSVRDAVSGAASSLVQHAQLLGGWPTIARFMGMFRPTRMFSRVPDLVSGRTLGSRNFPAATVQAIEPVGTREVVTISTSTETLVTEGLLSHNCFGNKMNWSVRWRAGQALEEKLVEEVAALALAHPRGFVVRLHVLGDFYSIAYVDLWGALLDRHRALHVFGYTARDPASDPIGVQLDALSNARWGRFAMRFSNSWRAERSSLTLWRPGRIPPNVGIVCPAQTGRSDCCATCGLCWATRRNIFFQLH